MKSKVTTSSSGWLESKAECWYRCQLFLSALVKSCSLSLWFPPPTADCLLSLEHRIKPLHSSVLTFWHCPSPTTQDPNTLFTATLMLSQCVLHLLSRHIINRSLLWPRSIYYVKPQRTILHVLVPDPFALPRTPFPFLLCINANINYHLLGKVLLIHWDRVDYVFLYTALSILQKPQLLAITELYCNYFFANLPNYTEFLEVEAMTH